MFLAAFALLSVGSTSLGSMDLSMWQQGWGKVQVNQTVSGSPVVVAGKTYSVAVGSHASGGGSFLVDGRASLITGSVAMADSGGGEGSFAIYGDSRRLWQSENLKKGDPPKPLSVDLSGVRVLTLTMSDGLNGTGGDHAVWIDVQISHTGAIPTPLPFIRTLTVRLDQPKQTIDNFAASDAWTIEQLFKWPEARRKEVARLLFDRNAGAGLSGWRFNLGGGRCRETIGSDRGTLDSYDAGEGKFDFNKCPGQQWMLKAAKDYGVSQITAFSITPPRRLSLNGFTNGTDGLGTMNLKPGMAPAYGRYLAGIIDHFVKQGYPITHISPINEPDYEWNGVPNPIGQEGSRASNDDIREVGSAIAAALKARGLSVKLLTPEASSPQTGSRFNKDMEKKYGKPYGGHALDFANHLDWVKEVGLVYGYHAYWAESTDWMAVHRIELRKTLDKLPGTKAWMTEFCEMAGPRGEGGWGRDSSMTLALNVARMIHLDMTLVDASAWQWWLAVSEVDYKDGIIYVDDIGKSDGEVFPTKSLWTIGQYSRFVRPGYIRVDTEGPFDNVTGTMASAYKDPKTGKVVVVWINTEMSSETVALNLKGSWGVSAWITSDRPGQDIAPYKDVAVGKPFKMPSRAVITMVLTPTDASGGKETK